MLLQKNQLTSGIGCKASFLFVLNVGMLCRKQDMLIPCFFVDSMSHKPNSLNAIWMTGQIPEFEIHNPCIFDNAKIRSKHANLEIYMDHLIDLFDICNFMLLLFYLAFPTIFWNCCHLWTKAMSMKSSIAHITEEISVILVGLTTI